LPIDMDLQLTTNKIPGLSTGEPNVPVEWTRAAILNNLGSVGAPFVHHVVPRWSTRVATNERALLYKAPDKILNGPLASRWLGQSRREIESEIAKAIPDGELEKFAEVRMPARGDPTVQLPNIIQFIICDNWRQICGFCTANQYPLPAVITKESKTVVRVHSSALYYIVRLIYNELDKGKLFMNLRDSVTLTLTPLDKKHLALVKQNMEQFGTDVDANYAPGEAYNPHPHPEFLVRVRLTYYKISDKSTEFRQEALAP
jgi:hypothetical protein